MGIWEGCRFAGKDGWRESGAHMYGVYGGSGRRENKRHSSLVAEAVCSSSCCGRERAVLLVHSSSSRASR